MIVFALCDDRRGSSEARDALFQIHSAHVVNVVGRIMLAAPFGPVDGLHPLATEGLTGSIFAIEAQDVAEAAGLMQDDPYTGAVWAQVEMLAVDGISGRWTEPGHEPIGGIVAGDGRYLLLSREPCPDGADALLAANVRHAGMVVGNRQSDCRGILVVGTPDLAAATTLGRAWHGGRDVADAMAIPVGMGRWPGYPQIPPA